MTDFILRYNICQHIQFPYIKQEYSKLVKWYWICLLAVIFA